MTELLRKSFQTITDYGGNGLLLLYFLGALCFLLIFEKKKETRKLLGAYPAALLVLFMLPVTPYLYCKVLGEEETFYRFLWLIPVTAVSAYATILLLTKIKLRVVKLLVAALAAAFVAIAGNPGYQSPVMVPAQNAYQIPQEVVDLCDAIVIPGREVECVFPHELVPYIRQYTPYIVMPYGYETMVDRWGFSNDLADEMILPTSSAERLAFLSREEGCQFIVLNKDHLLDGEITDYEFEVLFETEHYVAYRDARENALTPWLKTAE